MIKFVRASSEDLETVNTFSPNAQGCFCFWINGTSISTLDQYPVGLEANFRLRFPNIGAKLYVNLFGGNNKWTISNTAFSDNVTYHVAINWDDKGTSTDNDIYVNGVLDIADNKQDGTVTAGTLHIGGPSFHASYFDGTMEDFRYYDRELTANEIATIYASRGVDGIRQGLVNRWMMNEGAEGATVSGAGSVKDSVGNNNLSPVNTPTYEGSDLKFRRIA